MSSKTPSDSFQLPPDDSSGKMTNEELAKFLEEHSNKLNKMANASNVQPAEFDASQLDLDSLAAEIDKISDAAPWDKATAGNKTDQKIDASNFPDDIPTEENQFSFSETNDDQQTKSTFEMPNFDSPKKSMEENEPLKSSLGDIDHSDTQKFTPSSFEKTTEVSRSKDEQTKDSSVEKSTGVAGALGGIAAGAVGSTFALGKEANKGNEKTSPNETRVPDKLSFGPITRDNNQPDEFTSKETAHELNPATRQKEEIEIAEPKKSEGVPFFAFLLLLSYASLATLGLVYFMMQAMNGNSKDLESLPDIVPPMNGDQVMYPLVPESRNMANGHSLKLGTSRRFGNLIVTPVGVTRESLEFVHYSGDETKQREEVKPVLKLWLRFENVSKDQTIVPLDRKLMLTRNPDPNDPEWLRSNNFVVKKQNKSKPKKQWLIYDMEINGDWNFADGPNERAIKPGEKLDTYLPSEVIEEDLDGRLVWRVHFRKGHNPETKNGVTTLIEVLFDDTDIKEPIEEQV